MPTTAPPPVRLALAGMVGMAVAMALVVLVAPGLGWLAQAVLFGGGQMTRWVHPWIGVLLFFMSLVPFALDYGSEFHWRQPLPAALSSGSSHQQASAPIANATVPAVTTVTPSGSRARTGACTINGRWWWLFWVTDTTISPSV